MKQHSPIQKLFALFLVATFALGNFPTKFLHMAFANHTDVESKIVHNQNGEAQFSLSGINCHCDNVVIVSPFNSNIQNKSFAQANFFPDFFIEDVLTLPVADTYFYQLRAPPFVS